MILDRRALTSIPHIVFPVKGSSTAMLVLQSCDANISHRLKILYGLEFGKDALFFLHLQLQASSPIPSDTTPTSIGLHTGVHCTRKSTKVLTSTSESHPPRREVDHFGIYSLTIALQVACKSISFTSSSSAQSCVRKHHGFHGDLRFQDYTSTSDQRLFIGTCVINTLPTNASHHLAYISSFLDF